MLRGSPASFLLIAIGCCSISGCLALPVASEFSHRVEDFVSMVHERQRLAVDAMRMRREATVAQLKMQNAALRDDFEREHAEALIEREAGSTRYDEKLRTQLGLEISQQFELGQLEVDTAQLRQLLDARDKQHQGMLRAYEQVEGERKQALQDQYLREVRQALTAGDRPRAQALMAQYGCSTIAPNCAEPLLDKALNQEALQQPVQAPLLPTDIPIKIPVRLRIEMGGPRLSQTDVKRIPRPQPDALRECQSCTQCGRTECSCEAPARKPEPSPAPAINLDSK